MSARPTRSLTLAAALIIGGCAHRAPEVAAAQPPLPTKPTVGQELGAAVENQLVISFAEGSARLPPDAAHQLDVAARLFRDVGPARMFAIGHSDAQGQEFGNVVLAAQRARVVKEALVARGIPRDRLYIQSLGESEPVNRRDPNDSANRRVVVKWEVL